MGGPWVKAQPKARRPVAERGAGGECGPAAQGNPLAGRQPLEPGPIPPSPPPTTHTAHGTAGADPPAANPPQPPRSRGGPAAPHHRPQAGPEPKPSSHPPTATGGRHRGTKGGRLGALARPPPSPPSTPLSPRPPPPPGPRYVGGRPRGRQPFTPPARPGEAPPREGCGTRGGAPLGAYTTSPHTTTRPLPQ